mmetsp:Transcript_113764/g.223162  ORF Transcript_113764/g.223162 Transcript_113764/m.223162 type:complete len:220 (+) Transcript_113764:262-921(+)
MPITRTSDISWNPPLPTLGHPNLAQRMAAMQLAARSHSSLSSSSSSSTSSFASAASSSSSTTTATSTTPVPTTVTITTSTTTTTAAVTATPEPLSREDAGDHDNTKSAWFYTKVVNDDDGDDEEEDDDNSWLEHDDDEEEDDNISWEYEDLEDDDNDSLVKLFKVSQRPRFLRCNSNSKDLYPRDNGDGIPSVRSRGTTSNNVDIVVVVSMDPNDGRAT